MKKAKAHDIILLMKPFKLSVDHSLLICPREVSGPFLFSTTFFFLFALVGYVVASVYPSSVVSSIDALMDMAEEVSGMSVAGLTAFIFINNSFVALVASLGGVFFSFLPIFIILVNGFTLGIVYYLTASAMSPGFFLMGVLPHGVIEIPAILFSTAIGIWLGSALFNFLFKGEEDRDSLKKKIKRALYTYFTIIIPILFLAALVEMFLTPVFLDVFFDLESVSGLTQ
ncbi:MAG: stage II sporulation protein M [Patescibacteria group bacterium]